MKKRGNRKRMPLSGKNSRGAVGGGGERVRVMKEKIKIFYGFRNKKRVHCIF